VYLRDLVFLEEGNSSVVGEDSHALINYSKMELMGGMYEEIALFQQGECSFKPNAEMQSYLFNLQTLSDDDLYEVSKRVPLSTK